MSPLTLVMLCIVIAVGIILVFLLLFYFIGNIYNGLVRRRIRVKTSWYEINKLFTKFFELLPETIKSVENSEEQEILRTSYQKYQNLKDRDDITTISTLYLEIIDILIKYHKSSSETVNDSATFLKEYVSKISFSIPLYNNNALQYNHFRKLPINIVMARLFKFKPATLIFDKNNTIESKN